MEETNVPSVATEPVKGCLNCGHPIIVPGYPNPLCEDCRNRFIHFPVPAWIKIFGIAIGLLFLFSLYKIPRNISLGLHFEKGKTAIAEKKFITAQRELEIFLKAFPRHTEARCYLLIASFQNQDYPTMSQVYQDIKNERIEDQELFNQVQTALDRSEDYFPDAALTDTLHRYGDDINNLPLPVLKKYLDKNPENNYAAYVYAASLTDAKEYQKADSIDRKVLERNPNLSTVLLLAASQLRLEKKFDSSLTFCNRMLSINKENIMALASKARTLLWKKEDKEALRAAQQAADLAPENPYVKATLLLAFHFTGQEKKEKALLNEYATSKDTVLRITLQYAVDVINGKEPFRN